MFPLNVVRSFWSRAGRAPAGPRFPRARLAGAPERLEVRVNPQATVYVDFGFGFPGPANALTVTDADMLLPTINGPTEFDDGAALKSLARTVQERGFDADGNGTPGTPEDARFLADQVKAVMARALAPFSVTLVEAAADSVADIADRLDDQATADAYLVIAGQQPPSANEPAAAPDNFDDNTAFVFADRFFDLVPTDRIHVHLAFLALEMAGTTFGLARTDGSEQTTVGDVMGAGFRPDVEDTSLIPIFTRYFLPGVSDGLPPPVNTFDGMSDPSVGAKPASQFPGYVTGTGAADVITVRPDPLKARTANVTVQPAGEAVFAYDVSLDSGLLIEAGAGDDEIRIDASLGVTVTVRGMGDLGHTERLIITGTGAENGVFRPAGVVGQGLDRRPDYRGSIAVTGVGVTTLIDVSEFGPDSVVRVENFASFGYQTPNSADVLTIDSSAPGTPPGQVYTEIDGTSSGVGLINFHFNQVANLFLDLAGAGGGDNDTVTINPRGFAAAGLQGVTLDTGPDDDTLVNRAASLALTGPNGQVRFEGGGGADGIRDQTANANAWTINAFNHGNLNNQLTFDSVETLRGGSGVDDFVFLLTGSFTGDIDGGAGASVDRISFQDFGQAVSVVLTDAVAGNGSVTLPVPKTGFVVRFTDLERATGSALADRLADLNSTFTLTGPNSGDVDGFLFDGIENLAGGAADDLLVIGANGSLSGSFDGAGGVNTIDDESGTDNFFQVTGANAGRTDAVAQFVNVQDLIGDTGIDTFLFLANAALGGRIDGEAGADALDYSQFHLPVTFDLGQRASTGLLGSAPNALSLEKVIGGALLDTLVGLPVASAWTLTGHNIGQVNGFQFEGIENLTGSNGAADTFVLNPGGSSTGTLTAGDAPGVQDTLIDNSNVAAIVTLTGANQGTSDKVAFFVGVENLSGGPQGDTFGFRPGGLLTGFLDGDGGLDRLDFSALASQAVRLTGAGLTDGFNGTTALVGGFGDLNGVIGSASGAADELLGLDAASFWDVTGTNAGLYQAAGRGFDFTRVERLVGGGLDDTFTVHAGGQVTGLLDANAPASGSDLLVVTGGPFADNVALRQGGVTVNGLDTLFADVEEVRLLGNGGRDRLTVRFDLGDPVPIDGVSADGGPGFDVLTVVGTALNDTMSLGPSQVAVNAAVPVTFSALEQVDLFARDGNDRLDAPGVSYQAGLAGVRFFGEGGDDRITLAPSATTQFYVHGGGQAKQGCAGDVLLFYSRGQSMQGRALRSRSGFDGLFGFRNRRAVQFVSIEQGAGSILFAGLRNDPIPNLF